MWRRRITQPAGAPRKANIPRRDDAEMQKGEEVVTQGCENAGVE